MGVKTKGRRKITVGDREFVWYVADDEDSADYVLQVLSHDKAFIVNYHLGQPNQTRFLAVLGREFPGLPEAGKVWLRVLCPQWEDENGAMTPAGVRKLIEWCLLSERELVPVDYRGQPLVG